MPSFEQNLALLDVDLAQATKALSVLLLQNFTRVTDLFRSWDTECAAKRDFESMMPSEAPRPCPMPQPEAL